jgi:hypothetical protein
MVRSRKTKLRIVYRQLAFVQLTQSWCARKIVQEMAVDVEQYPTVAEVFDNMGIPELIE